MKLEKHSTLPHSMAISPKRRFEKPKNAIACSAYFASVSNLISIDACERMGNP